MQKITLYEFQRDYGNISVSPDKPDCEYQTSYRLIADEGMILTDTNGYTAKVIDTDTPELWSEVEAPKEETEDEVDEPLPEPEPTTEEILNALLGVTKNE